MPSPIYTPENCRFAYQLNWSLSIFPTTLLPSEPEWLEALKVATEPDGVRILEHRRKEERVHQFLLSAQPHVSPADAVRFVKGRLQYLVRVQLPRAFRRHYHIHSIGEVSREPVEKYIRSQCDHHPMADPRVQDRLAAFQVDNPSVDLDAVRASGHGQFIYNLHLVFVHRQRGIDVHEESLRAAHEMIQRASAGHERLLSKTAVLSDHLHLAVGCGIDESPQKVALSYLNNLAYAQGMKAEYEFGAYLGTFGRFDRGAVRKALGKS